MTRPLDEIDAVARKFKMPMTDGPHYADHVLATLIADLTHHVRALAESVDRKCYRPPDGSSASSPSSPSDPHAAYWAEKERGDGLAYDLERTSAALARLRAENERLRAVVAKADGMASACENIAAYDGHDWTAALLSNDCRDAAVAYRAAAEAAREKGEGK